MSAHCFFANASAALKIAPLCRAALQLAVDAPTNSLVAKNAAGLPRPKARLLTKELDWPALMMTLLGHSRGVERVAFTKDGEIQLSRAATAADLASKLSYASIAIFS